MINTNNKNCYCTYNNQVTLGAFYYLTTQPFHIDGSIKIATSMTRNLTGKDSQYN